MADHILLKLVLAPFIIAAATLIARRWGENIGGLVVGLPLTSGPVSIFFAIEQSPAFAANAARGAMLGLVPVAVFCLGYVYCARRFSWYLSAGCAITLYFVTVLAVSSLPSGLGLIVLLVSVVLAFSLAVVGKPGAQARQVTFPAWDLPLRMVVSAALIFSITTGASMLGSKWSGLLSPFPVFTFVMATFSHKQGGPTAAWWLIRGILSGLFSYLAFFLVIALLVERAPLPLVYGFAACTALGVNAVSLAILVNGRRLSSPTGL